MSSRRSWIAALGGLGAATVVSVTCGCGWSARDTHLAKQKVSFQPASGDGSSRFSRLPEDPFREHRGTAAVDLNGR